MNNIVNSDFQSLKDYFTDYHLLDDQCILLVKFINVSNIISNMISYIEASDTSNSKVNKCIINDSSNLLSGLIDFLLYKETDHEIVNYCENLLKLYIEFEKHYPKSFNIRDLEIVSFLLKSKHTLSEQFEMNRYILSRIGKILKKEDEMYSQSILEKNYDDAYRYFLKDNNYKDYTI